jgi:transcriptional regulator with XRE-family HTH domain
MPKQPLESLGAIVRTRRGKKKLRETAREIGIGPATLMRVENGRIPDVVTFGKICKWAKIDPRTFLGFETNPSQTTTENAISSISAHFRSDRTPAPDTVRALAQMVLFTLRAQPRSPDQDS